MEWIHYLFLPSVNALPSLQDDFACAVKSKRENCSDLYRVAINQRIASTIPRFGLDEMVLINVISFEICC